MKAKLKARFLPPSYVQDSYSQLHNLTQGSMSVDEYTREFEKLLIKCDINEPEEQIDLNLSMLMWLNSSNLPHLTKYVYWHISWISNARRTHSDVTIPNLQLEINPLTREF